MLYVSCCKISSKCLNPITKLAVCLELVFLFDQNRHPHPTLVVADRDNPNPSSIEAAVTHRTRGSEFANVSFLFSLVTSDKITIAGMVWSWGKM